MFSFIGAPLGWIMSWMYELIQNYGIVLILFTILVRLLLFPLNIKQQKSTAKMALLQPKQEKLQRKYGKDKQRYNEELMKLYEEEGYNPMASCWPMLLQMLFLFGIIEVVYRPLQYILKISKDTIEAATEILTSVGEGAAANATNAQINIISILQGTNTSYAADVVAKIEACFTPEALEAIRSFELNCFGLNMGGNINASWPLILLPILSGVTSLIVSILSIRQQKKNAASKEQQQTMKTMNTMMYLMPVLSVWMAFKFPIGFIFYWIASNVFSIAQTAILGTVYSPEKMKAKVEAENAERKKNPTRFQQAMKDARKMQAIKEGRTFDDKPVDLTEEGEVPAEETKKQMTSAERIAAARKRMAEKYGDDYDA